MTTPAPTTEPAAAPAAPVQTSSPESNASVPVEAERCTNRIDYADDPRSNAEINSIGESTGVCPQPSTSLPSPEPVPDDRCTNQIDYAGDPRSNAEINSIGEATGACPAPIPS
ncbi:hypothetical protein GCM10007304_18500 [Rhodococcoides trifolii]|uniref:Uncharacterized protein n=1 Tax=Rhodococcoides trifolii TaxID=908250 RepID=A0A917D042_9NOCA|nr:hypothetical protein GCM10007304_18500 [Rhodococcus trifolii]